MFDKLVSFIADSLSLLFFTEKYELELSYTSGETHSKFKCCLFPLGKCELSLRTALGIITDIPDSINLNLKV